MNYPFKSVRQRGYIFYNIGVWTDDGHIGSNIVNYIHYNHPFRIPYTKTEDVDTMFNNNRMQHCTNYTNMKYKNETK